MIIETQNEGPNEKINLSPLLMTTVFSCDPFSLYPLIKPFLTEDVDISGIEIFLKMRILEALQNKKNAGAIDDSSALSLKFTLSASDNDDGNLQMMQKMMFLGGQQNMFDMKSMMLMNAMNGGDGSMNALMPFLYMQQMGGDDENAGGMDMNMLMTISMFSGGNPNMQQMLPFVMMNQNKEGGGGIDMKTIMMMSMFGGDNSNMMQMLPLVMMNQGDENGEGGGMDMNSIMPFLVMSSMGGNAGKETKGKKGDNQNPMSNMMPFLMMNMLNKNENDDSNPMSNMMPFMAISMMNGGGGGMNQMLMIPMIMSMITQQTNQKKQQSAGGKKAKQTTNPAGPAVGGVANAA